MNDTTETNCTCPSGNGSLRHPCPTHIDRRAAGNTAAAQEAAPYGYVFTDDPEKFAMPGGGFHLGPVPPKDAINVIPLYAAPVAAAPVDLPTPRSREKFIKAIEGMSVSVDVDRLFDTDGRRLFGTVTEAMWDRDDKHGLTLLVQDAQPNWEASTPAAPVEGGQITGWRNVDGMAVFTVASHSGITANQEFVRYDDHLAKLASTPAAPGIDHAEMVKSNLRSIKSLARVLPISAVSAANIVCEADHAITLIDASPKGGSDAEVMQLRYQLNSLRQLLSGFDVAVQNNPLQPPCTYLEEVRLSHEFQPGEGQKVATALRNALNSEGAKS